MTNPFDTEDRNPKVTVAPVDRSRADFVKQAGGDAAFRGELAAAGVLLVPLSGHGDYSAPVFPQGTMEVLRYLQEQLPSGVRADIAVEDEAYEELTLHAADVLLPTFLTNTVLAGLAINLVSSYLYDLFKDAKARRETRVKARVLVETDQRTVAIDYDGPAEQFAEITRHALTQEVPEADQGGAAILTDDGRPNRHVDAGAPKRLLEGPVNQAPEAGAAQEPVPRSSPEGRVATERDGAR